MNRTAESFWSMTGLWCVLAVAGNAQMTPVLPATTPENNGIHFTSPLSLGGGADDGFIAGTQRLSDTVSVVSLPTLAIADSTELTKFSLGYLPEFEAFSEHPNLDAWSHAGTMIFEHRLTPRFIIDAGDTFLSTADASRQLGASVLLLPRGRFIQNSAYLGFSYRFSRHTTVVFSFDNAVVRITPLGGPSLAQFNQLSGSGGVSLQHSIGRRHLVSANYSYLLFRPIAQSGPGPSSPVSSASTAGLGYTFSVNPGLVLQFTGGLTQAGQLAYIATAGVDKRIGAVWAGASYQRSLAFESGISSAGFLAGAPAPPGLPLTATVPFANGLLSNSLFEIFSVHAKGQASKRVMLQLEGNRARNSAGLPGANFRTWVGRAGVDFKLTDRFVAFARAEFYGQNANAFVPIAMNRRVYLGGLEVVLWRPPEGASSGSALPAVLPARGLNRAAGQAAEN